MSSRRFPGKVLAPFRGRPIIAHVLDRVDRALPGAPRVVVTSSEQTDDPLAVYVRDLGVSVFRGPLHDVFERFRRALAAHPCVWVLRVCADSPLLEEEMLRSVVAARSANVDLITTTQRRTFPRGSNAELIRTAALDAMDPTELTPEDREHVTPFFHRNPARFRIVNVESGDPRRAELSVAVDTLDDLTRLEGAP
jgi:spore coat polysaccharide biosynthesis protein SpsF